MWFEGHGTGELLLVPAQRGAPAEIPANVALLEQQIEAATVSR